MNTNYIQARRAYIWCKIVTTTIHSTEDYCTVCNSYNSQQEDRSKILPSIAKRNFSINTCLARYFPSGLNATEYTGSVCLDRVCTHLPFSISHSLTVESKEALARNGFAFGLSVDTPKLPNTKNKINESNRSLHISNIAISYDVATS